jgi:molybdopterin-binding protein
MNLIRLRVAARQLGVSYPTLKQWIYRERIRSVKTAGGHHRIPESEINRLLFQKQRASERPTARSAFPRSEENLDVQATGLEHVISGRNQLVGRIIRVRQVGLLAEVALDIGGQTVTSIITRRACLDLRLKVGETAAALIKATEVMIIRPPSVPISSR